MTVHADRGRVHDAARVRERARQVVRHVDPVLVEPLGESHDALLGSIEVDVVHGDMCGPLRQQAVGDRDAGSPRPDDDGPVVLGAGQGAAEGAGEAGPVGVATEPHPVAEDDGVDGTQVSSRLGEVVEQRYDGLLERVRHVEAVEPQPLRPVEQVRQVVDAEAQRAGIDDPVAHGEPVLAALARLHRGRERGLDVDADETEDERVGHRRTSGQAGGDAGRALRPHPYLVRRHPMGVVRPGQHGDRGDRTRAGEEQRDRGPVAGVAAEQGLGNGGREPCEGEAELRADGHAGEPDAGREVLGVRRRPDRVGHAVDDAGQQHAEHEDEHLVGVGDGAEEGEGQDPAADDAGDEDRLAADPVRERGPERDDQDRDDVRHDRHPEHQGVVDADVVGGREAQREHGEHRVDRSDERGEEHPHDAHPVVAEQLAERRLGDRTAGRLDLEFRRLVEVASDHVPDEHDHRADPERDPPPPRHQLLVGKRRCQRKEDRRRQDLSALGAAQGEAGEETATVIGRVLEGHRVGAGLLARCGEALQQPKQDEQDRREDADLAVRRQAADQERGDTHQQQRRDQDPAPAQAVADVSHEERPDRTGDVRNAEGGERGDVRGRVVALREEDVGEHERCCCAVDGEVVVLQRAADPRCQRCLLGCLDQLDHGRKSRSGSPLWQSFAKFCHSRSWPPPCAPIGQPTITDVARAAGVAPSTVSRAFSRPGRVNHRTREHVLAVAESLGYQPNPAAQALESGRTRTIGLLVPDITNPYFSGVIKGAERAAAAAGLTLLLGDTQENPAQEAAMVRGLGRAVDGFVLSASRLSDGDLHAAAARVPIALVNRAVAGVACVVADYETGTREIVEHLASYGHQSFVFAGGPAESWSGASPLGRTAYGGRRARPRRRPGSARSSRLLPAGPPRQTLSSPTAPPPWCATTTCSPSA